MAVVCILKYVLKIGLYIKILLIGSRIVFSD